MYEIFLGGWDNTKCAIRFNQEKPDVAMTEGSLSRDSFQKFWIRVNYAAIKVHTIYAMLWLKTIHTLSNQQMSIIQIHGNMPLASFYIFYIQHI